MNSHAYISNICTTEYRNFLNKSNVIGVGVGYKITNRILTSQICIHVFVTKKLPNNQLSSTNIIPKTYKGIKTDVIEVGELKIQALTARVRPMPGGYSIGPYINNILIAGTAGCLVKDNSNKLYILSNNHVLTNENSLPLGSPILQPGTYDGGKLSTDQIAKLSKYIPLKFKVGTTSPINSVDAAIAAVNSNSLVSSSIAIVGNVKGVASASLNLAVKKVGRTTALTTGLITSTNATISVSYSNNNTALFTNQIVTTAMSAAGDSGSLLLNNNNYAVGLLFAGSTSTTIYNPISSVLSSLGVTLVTG